jgi:hypothetical protein
MGRIGNRDARIRGHRDGSVPWQACLFQSRHIAGSSYYLPKFTVLVGKQWCWWLRRRLDFADRSIANNDVLFSGCMTLSSWSTKCLRPAIRSIKC